MSKKDDPRDLNEDGKISASEQEWYDAVNPDPLSAKELAQKYGFALRVLRGNDELWKLFQKAVKGQTAGDQWTVDKFTVELQNSDWWAENNEYARKAWTAQQLGGEDWKTSVETAEAAVKNRAIQFGIKLSDRQLAQMGARYIYEGWGDPRRATFLDSELAKYVGKNDGPGNVALASDLRNIAWQYGVSISDREMARIERQILRGDITSDIAEQTIKDRAASKYKPIADKIKQGETTRDALSQYLSTVSDLLELGGEDKVDMDDPLIKQALGSQGVNEEMMTVYDFERSVRKDARWRKTRNGQMQTVNLAQDFLKSLGF